MATLAANKARTFEDGDVSVHPMIASDIIYEGAACGFSSTSGNVRPLVAGDQFAGFAVEKIDNSSGAAGDKNIRLRRRGYVKLTVSGAAVGDEGQGVYASDDDTFTATSEAANSRVGTIERIDSSGVAIVKIETADLEKQEAGGNGVPATATFALDAEASNEITATVTVKDANGNALGEGQRLYAVLCSDSSGLVIEPHSATLTIAAGAVGAVELKAAANALGHSGFWIVTSAAGVVEVSITQTSGADTFYLAVQMPNGRQVVSSAITFAA